MQGTQEIWVCSWGREDPLEKVLATHFSILAWEIPWTEDPGGLQSMEWQWDTTECALIQTLTSLRVSNLTPRNHREKSWKNHRVNLDLEQIKPAISLMFSLCYFTRHLACSLKRTSNMEACEPSLGIIPWISVSTSVK